MGDTRHTHTHTHTLTMYFTSDFTNTWNLAWDDKVSISGHS